MTSLGSSCLKYMKALKPELERRGFELAIFHATGMGGMAFEGLASAGHFAAVMDFALCEIGNLIVGSLANAGKDRLRGAGRAGIPQIVAPGAIDMIDFAGWQDVPERYADRPFHAHNRLIKSAVLGPDERRATAREVAQRLAEAAGPTHLILPVRGIEEWDREGGATHDPAGLAAFVDEMRRAVAPPVRLHDIDAHINDRAFVETALAIFDGWLADGTIKTR
jgi:uncharacterized protein (UPF0261 family)